MPYAEGRVFNDADSHVMETPDWMLRYADPGLRDRLAPLDHPRDQAELDDAWGPGRTQP